MSHQDILHLLCAGELCSDAALRCSLFHNSVLWPSDDAARRALASGDYMKLRIQSLDDSSSCMLMEQIRAQENAEANRFLFRASPLSEGPGESVTGSEPGVHDDLQHVRPTPLARGKIQISRVFGERRFCNCS